MSVTPQSVQDFATTACMIEVTAEKPGNVTPTHAFGDMTHQDFLNSALAIGPVMAQAGESGVGATILAAVSATRQRVSANTNLGIVLLLAPLAHAALTGNGLPLRERLREVLRDLTVDDARDAFEAIRLAHPGGLNTASAGDVNAGPPSMTLREAMQLAAERDSIAAEYVSDFRLTFEVALPALRRAQHPAASPYEQVAAAYVDVLGQVPDTLIARKCGWATAREVSARAAAITARTPVHSSARAAALAEFDAWLRRDGNRLNPGTTADLMAAALFVRFLHDQS